MNDETAQLMEEVDTENQKSVSYDDETVIWEGRPSQWVNLGTFLWWGVFFIGSAVSLFLWDAGLNDGYSALINEAVYWVCYGLMGLSIISVLYAYLSVHYEHTVITRNKIKEAKGITSIFRQELFCEISDIKDIHCTRKVKVAISVESANELVRVRFEVGLNFEIQAEWRAGLSFFWY